jgi:excisionase family DNA binding protein
MIELRGTKYYSTDEVAEMFQLSGQTMRRYIKNGKLVAIKHGNKILIEDVEVKRFEDLYMFKAIPQTEISI